jgi:ribosomal protein S17
MATKAEVTGVIVSDRMDKSVVVAIERQVRDALYGKIQRRTSKFLAHDEGTRRRSATASPSPRRGRSAAASAGS